MRNESISLEGTEEQRLLQLFQLAKQAKGVQGLGLNVEFVLLLGGKYSCQRKLTALGNPRQLKWTRNFRRNHIEVS
jgi:hypothetical protein